MAKSWEEETLSRRQMEDHLIQVIGELAEKDFLLAQKAEAYRGLESAYIALEQEHWRMSSNLGRRRLEKVRHELEALKGERKKETDVLEGLRLQLGRIKESFRQLELCFATMSCTLGEFAAEEGKEG